MKVNKTSGVRDSVIVELLTYHSNGQLASTKNMAGRIQQGKYTAFSRGGQIIVEGRYENDKRHKKWVWTGEDGIPDSIITYKVGLLSGKVLHYGPNGQILIKGQYVNNQKHGKWIWTGEDGLPDSLKTFEKEIMG